jgi:hypothetical protein
MLFRVIYFREGRLRGVTFAKPTAELAANFAAIFCRGWADLNEPLCILPVHGRQGSPENATRQGRLL